MPDTVQRNLVNSMADPVPPWGGFGAHHAFIVGINAYANGIAPLRTAANDARRLAEILAGTARRDRFLVHPPLIDAGATGSQVRDMLRTTMRQLVGPNDRVLVYFAGHGIAADGDDGPAGYLVPSDASPQTLSSFIAMTEVQAALDALPCRHLLVILDCCFSGAFRWSSQHRAIGTVPKRIYRERFDRFARDSARQVITSAAYDQRALDVLAGKAIGDRGLVHAADGAEHSPFALALFAALDGQADAKLPDHQEGDGVITATELYLYIRDQVEPATIAANERLRQTPSFFPLRNHDKGEFLFLHPSHRLNLPEMDPGDSPYKGLESFNEGDAHLFYGREDVVAKLRQRADDADGGLIVVTGASGTGKSSVIKAGLLPQLRAAMFNILPVMRPGEHPLESLEATLKGAVGPAVLVVDQLEEVITRCTDPAERRRFDERLAALLDAGDPVARIVLTVRSDFEPQVNRGALAPRWAKARFTVPPFSAAELREVVVMPAMQSSMVFEPPKLVDQIVEEVVQSPGALPLLSYALSELFLAHQKRGGADRELTQDDYEGLGGVRGALTTRADALHDGLDAAQRDVLRRIMLRMVSLEGDLASKRVATGDLAVSAADAPVVEHVVGQLVESRLVVRGGGHDAGADFIEPAHDALVRAWPRLREWIDETGRDTLILASRVAAAAEDHAHAPTDGLLWNNNPNLPAVQKALMHGRTWFNLREQAFIRRSVALKKRRFRIGIGVTAGVVLALAGVTVAAWLQRDAAVTAAALASAGRLAAESRTAMTTDPVASVLLAVEATRVGPRSTSAVQDEAEGTLRAALAATGGFSLSRFGYIVRTIQTDAEGKLVALNGVDSAGRCKSIEIWKRRDEGWYKQRSLDGTDDCGTFQMSSDGKWLVSVGRSSRALLWHLNFDANAAPGQPLVVVEKAVNVGMSLDGHWVAVAEPIIDSRSTSELPADWPSTDASKPRVRGGERLRLFRLAATGLTDVTAEIGDIGIHGEFVFDSKGSALAFAGPSVERKGLIETGPEGMPFGPKSDKERRSANLVVISLATAAREMPVAKLDTNCHSIAALTLSESGRVLGAVCESGVRVWQRESAADRWQPTLSKSLNPDDSGFGVKMFGVSNDDGWLALGLPPDGNFATPKVRLLRLAGTSMGMLVPVGTADDVRFSPDSKWLVAGRLDRITMANLQELDLSSGRSGLSELGDSAARASAFGVDSYSLISSNRSGTLTRWQNVKGAWHPLHSIRNSGHQVERIVLAPSGKTLIAVDSQGSVRVHELDSMQPSNGVSVVWGWDRGSDRDVGTTFNPSTLLSRELDQIVASGWMTRVESEKVERLTGLVWELSSPDLKWKASYRVAIGEGVRAPGELGLSRASRTGETMTSQVICPAGRQSVRDVWDAKRKLQFSRSGSLVVFPCESLDDSRGETSLVAAIEGPQGVIELRTLLSHFTIDALSISSDSRWIAVAGRSKGAPEVYLWQVGEGEWWRHHHRLTPTVPYEYPWSLDFDASAKWLGIACDGGVAVVDLTDAQLKPLVLTGDVQSRPASRLTFSPDGKWVVTSQSRPRDADTKLVKSDSGVRRWELVVGQGAMDRGSIEVSKGVPLVSADVAFSPNGRWLVATSPAADEAGRVGVREVATSGAVWDLQRGFAAGPAYTLPIAQEPAIQESGWIVRFDRSSQSMAIGQEGRGQVEVFELPTLARRTFSTTLGGSGPGNQDLQFSPDGSSIAVLSDGVQLWRRAGGPLGTSDFSRVVVPFGEAGSVEHALARSISSTRGVPNYWQRVSFSRDGGRLVALGTKVAAVWKVPLDEVLVDIPAVVGRNLSWTEWKRLFASSMYRPTLPGVAVDEEVFASGIAEVIETSEGAQRCRSLMAWGKMAEANGSADACSLVARKGVSVCTPGDMLKAADCAVRFGPLGTKHVETRGMVRARAGDYVGAVEDFERVTSMIEETDGQRLGQLKAWIADLKRGIDPFVGPAHASTDQAEARP